MSERARRWSIGELAHASGVTVRTLHHYDEIGLVPAGERTHAGHRRYTDTDVRRLYRVRALRQLGFSLDEIAAALERSTHDLRTLRDLLATQLAALDLKAIRIAELRERVHGLLQQLERTGMPGPEQFLATLETLPLLDTYLTRQQRDAITQRRNDLGDDTVDALRAEWLDLAHQLRQHLKDQTPVDDPDVQALAARWHQIGAAFRTGDPHIDAQVETAATALWRDHHGVISGQISDRIGWDDPGDMAGVVDYGQHVRASRPERTTS